MRKTISKNTKCANIKVSPKNHRRHWHTHCAAAGATQPNKYANGGYFANQNDFSLQNDGFKNKRLKATKNIRPCA